MTMWKKIVVTGAIAAAVLGSGTAAIAMSGSASGSGTPTASSATGATNAHAGRKTLATHALHGSFVTREKGSSTQFVTHDAIRGTVTAVSPESITVKAADNTSQTFVVNSATKVRQRANGKGAPGSIGAV
ncbi:MAG: hypothetical protein M3O28_11785, partial [Actinomycetota bacterium]|nr:hypothetical protein [Actinomycetota bacterium]